jgi:hypothetical protein
MGKVMVVMGMVVVAAARVAHGSPAFCGGKDSKAGNEDIYRLKTHQVTDRDDEVKLVWQLSCSNDDDVAQHRAEIDRARADWSKRLGMTDADWADVASFVDNREGKFIQIDMSSKDLSQFTPIDQYAAIHSRFGGSFQGPDQLYDTDVFESRMTETGRMAFLDWCIDDGSIPRIENEMPKWAVCWPDVEKFDVGKVLAEIKADTAHSGAVKMWLRIHAAGLPDAITDITAKKVAAAKADDTWQKMFDFAAKARDQWRADVGGNQKLLDLAARMDAGALFHSRKLFDGCEAATDEALAAAMASVPSKSFTGMHDDRELTKPGFAQTSGHVLVNAPAVNLAATAWSECHHDAKTADFLNDALQSHPGFRGPRNAALAAIMGQTYKFDDLKAPAPGFAGWGGRPASRSGGTIMSLGGVVKSVTKKADKLVVAIEKTSIMQDNCVKEHRSNRLSRIRPDGSLEYEMICDQTKTVKVDTTWSDFTITPTLGVEKALKPGVVFSSVNGEIIAIWPSKGAKTPSWVLGGAVK